MLAKIPEDLVPFAVLGFGGLLVAIITVIHGFGLDRIIRRYRRRADQLRKLSWHPSMAVLVFAGTILLLLLLHTLEICIWALFLHDGGLIADLHAAMYFSANTYTTLGMGPASLPHTWHEMGPLIAISGLFTFAWTTSEMFNIVGYQRELVADLEAKHESKRAASQGA